MIPSPPTNTPERLNQQPPANNTSTENTSTYQQNTENSNSQPQMQANPTNLYTDNQEVVNSDGTGGKNTLIIILLITLIILVLGGGIYTFWPLLSNIEETITTTTQPDNSQEEQQEETKEDSTPTISPKEDEPDEVDTITEPTLSYSIDYYNIDTADNVSLVRESSIDNDKERIIEESLAYMNTDPDFIEEYAFVIMDGSLTRDDFIPVGIWKDGQQVLIGTISENEQGAASEYNKYIVLDSSLESGELRAVLVHEIGHLVWYRLSPEKVKSYLETRDMTTAMISSWFNYLTKVANGEQSSPPMAMDVWTQSPSEDFAEVFKQVFGGPQDSGNYWSIKTVYGSPSEETKLWLRNETSSLFQVQ
jgi:hypothetical protein